VTKSLNKLTQTDLTDQIGLSMHSDTASLPDINFISVILKVIFSLEKLQKKFIYRETMTNSLNKLTQTDLV